MLEQTSVRAAVENEIKQLLPDQELSSLSGREELYELGMNSLTLARLIIQLEAVIGVDPFSQGATIADVRSVADLVATYERALAASPDNTPA
ncbi:phosphopantetheine-binding protein [Salinactinospora qingdaonensis]|uniref:Carrier domain-containing protein n=1 Tax=Salinactinospora qingdaonensis TaxID=702744 RepID=A0ABP7GNM7_9ACTN